MSLFDVFRGGDSKNASQDEVVELTNQFYVTLRAYFAKVKEGGQIRNQEAFKRAEELLKPGVMQNWTNAYEIEQLLVQLYGNDTLQTELRIRTMEAHSTLRTELSALYDKVVAEQKLLDPAPEVEADPDVIEHRRTLMARLVNDLQWRYIVNEATRRYSRVITSRTAQLSVSALFAFALLIAIIVGFGFQFRFGDLRLLLVAGLAGTWGATFSMLVSLKGRLDGSSFDDLKLMRLWPLLISRALIGAGAASILFFFLLSGLLGGSAFPLLSRPDGAPAAGLPTRDLALLVVWCFIAGFSEQLIPGLLASTEAKVSEEPATDRFRPTTGTAQVPPPPGSAPTEPGTDTPGGPLREPAIVPAAAAAAAGAGAGGGGGDQAAAAGQAGK